MYHNSLKTEQGKFPQHTDRESKKKRPILRFFLVGCGTIAVLIISIILWIAVSLFSGPDVMDMNSFHPFRSEKAKERYLSSYDERAKKWPIASEARMVETSYGQTFVRISGAESGEPLVLLPGGGANSMIWIPIIKTLSENYRTYAIDNIYDLGRSVYTRPMTTTDDLLVWLDDVFDSLNLEDEVNIMGLSYGGWLTCEYSLHAPSRLRRVVLLAPAATVYPLPPEVIKRMIIGILPLRYFMKSAVYWSLDDAVHKDAASKQFVDDHVDDTYLGFRCFKFKQPPAPMVLSDSKLHSIEVPTLFMVGENERIYDADKAVQRIKNVAPQIETEVIPNCGHDLWIVQPALVSSKILDFLKSD